MQKSAEWTRCIQTDIGRRGGGKSHTLAWAHHARHSGHTIHSVLIFSPLSLSLSLYVHCGGYRPLSKTASSVSRAFSGDQSMQTLYACSSLQQRLALVPESVAEGTHALSKTLALRENSSRKKSAPERSQWRFQWPLALRGRLSVHDASCSIKQSYSTRRTWMPFLTLRLSGEILIFSFIYCDAGYSFAYRGSGDTEATNAIFHPSDKVLGSN